MLSYTQAVAAVDAQQRQQIKLLWWEKRIHNLHVPLAHSAAFKSGIEAVYVTVTAGDIVGTAEVRGDGEYATHENTYHIIAALQQIEGRSLQVSQALKILRYRSKLAAMAIDMAAWDCYAKAQSKPLYRVFSTGPVNAIPTHGQVPFLGGQELERRIGDIKTLGFKRVKIRVGGSNMADDIARIRAVREALGADTEVMVDANGSWDARESLRFLDAAAEYNLSWLEQPSHHFEDVAEIFRANNTPTKIRVDESARDLESVKVFSDVSDGVHLKLEKVGTVQELIEIVQFCRQRDYYFALGQMDQGKLGCAVTTHLAAGLDVQEAELWGCADILNDSWQGLRLENGAVLVPQEHGIGLHRDEVNGGFKNTDSRFVETTRRH